MNSNLHAMKSLATIIIPTYNRSRTVLRALDSIKDQTYRPIEIVVIDDGSTDETEGAIRSWKEQNVNSSLTLYYTKKENGGPSTCRNLGIKQAHGEYLYFLDSDDYMDSNLLEEAIPVLEKERADCVIFGFDCEGPTGRRSTWLPPAQPALKSFFENALWGYTFSSLKRTALVRLVGLWNEQTWVAEDYEFLGRVLLQSEKTVVLRKALLTVSRGGESLGSQKETRRGLEYRLIAEKMIITEVLKHQGELPESLVVAYADRLIKTAINMYAKGEGDFARELGALALGLNVKTNTRVSRIKRYVWSQGRWACWLWVKLTRLYSCVNNWSVKKH